MRTHGTRIRREIIVAVALWVAGSICSSWAQGTSVQYFYDAVGHLIKTVDQNGNVAAYNYDAVGNILSISRSTPPANNGLAIISFTPQRGPVGQSVTIYGQGFSTIASANSVTFNGAAAAVISATANSLTTIVPSGAATGPTSVTAGGTTATSDANFTVVNNLVSISVTPQNSFMGIGSKRLFAATGFYSNGTSQNLTASVRWATSDPAVASFREALNKHCF